MNTIETPLTGEALEVAVVMKEAMYSPLRLPSIVETAIESELYGEAAQLTPSTRALAEFVVNLFRLRRLHVKTW